MNILNNKQEKEYHSATCDKETWKHAPANMHLAGWVLPQLAKTQTRGWDFSLSKEFKSRLKTHHGLQNIWKHLQSEFSKIWEFLGWTLRSQSSKCCGWRPLLLLFALISFKFDFVFCVALHCLHWSYVKDNVQVCTASSYCLCTPLPIWELNLLVGICECCFNLELQWPI